MRSYRRATYVLITFLSLGMLGCGSDNPTNEPSQDAIQKAEADRVKAIDADPNMTPGDKERMKAALSGQNPDSSREGK